MNLFLQLPGVSGRECYVQKKWYSSGQKPACTFSRRLSVFFVLYQWFPRLLTSDTQSIEENTYRPYVFFKGPLAAFPFEAVLTRSTVCVPPPPGILVAGRRKRMRFGSVLQATLARKIGVLLLDQDPFFPVLSLCRWRPSTKRGWTDFASCLDRAGSWLGPVTHPWMEGCYEIAQGAVESWDRWARHTEAETRPDWTRNVSFVKLIQWLLRKTAFKLLRVGEVVWHYRPTIYSHHGIQNDHRAVFRLHETKKFNKIPFVRNGGGAEGKKWSI